ncbi:MAG TPA: TetR/AcrR family transcriptional regulator [Alphaproteobacteria bacterium]|nr:TetR/AcrR family transcriptional regulator [Alphaproteobacteria bacterium]
MLETSDAFEHTVTPVSERMGTLAVIENCVAAIRRSFFADDSIPLFRLGMAIATQLPELSAALNGYFVKSLAPLADQIAMLERAGKIAVISPLEGAAQAGVMAVEGTRFYMGFAPPPAPLAHDYLSAVADLYLNGFLGRTVQTWPEFAPDPASTPDARTEALHGNLRGYFDDVADLRLGEDDLQRLVGVARKMFFAAGYRDTSLDEIGPAARIGRGTLYRWFGGKEALFRIAMLHAASELGARKLSLPKAGAPIEDTLKELALWVSGGLCGRVGTQLYRTVIAEANHDPALARTVFQLTRGRVASVLMPVLAATDAGRALTEAQLYWTAMQFVTLATDGNRYLSLNGRRGPDQRKALAERVTSSFLYGRRKLG